MYAQQYQQSTTPSVRGSLNRLLLTLGLLFGLATAMPAMALSLTEARDAGLVGEQSNGYLASVAGNPAGDVKALLKSINSKRRNAYISRAGKAGVSLEVMEQRVGQRLIEKLSSGQYFRSAGGNWQKK